MINLFYILFFKNIMASIISDLYLFFNLSTISPILEKVLSDIELVAGIAKTFLQIKLKIG